MIAFRLMRAVVVLIASMAALAGAAHAQPRPEAIPAVKLDLSSSRTSFAVHYQPAGEPRIRGVAKTSVERRLSEEGLTGAMGFMCGLQSGAELGGAAAMRGYDRTGRFVGARLSLPFR